MDILQAEKLRTFHKAILVVQSLNPVVSSQYMGALLCMAHFGFGFDTPFGGVLTIWPQSHPPVAFTVY